MKGKIKRNFREGQEARMTNKCFGPCYMFSKKHINKQSIRNLLIIE